MILRDNQKLKKVVLFLPRYLQRCSDSNGSNSSTTYISLESLWFCEFFRHVIQRMLKLDALFLQFISTFSIVALSICFRHPIQVHLLKQTPHEPIEHKASCPAREFSQRTPCTRPNHKHIGNVMGQC